MALHLDSQHTAKSAPTGNVSRSCPVSEESGFRKVNWPLLLAILCLCFYVSPQPTFGQQDAGTYTSLPIAAYASAPASAQLDVAATLDQSTANFQQDLLSFTPGPPVNPGEPPHFLRAYSYAVDANENLRLGNEELIDRFPWDTSSTQIFAASGRILTPNHGDVVYARRQGETLKIGFVNEPSVPDIYLPALADRLQQTSDFVAVAADDLDQAADADSNYHDEVAVAYATPGANSGQLDINLSVLDYTDRNAPAITTATLSAHVLNTSDFNYSHNASSGVLPIDNVLSLALGDFDGDGYKEIAVVYLGQHKHIYFDIFRYRTAADGSHKLLHAKTVSYSVASAPPLFLGSLSGTAGRFVTGGADQLAFSWGNCTPVFLIGYPRPISITTCTVNLAIVQFDRFLNGSSAGKTSFDHTTQLNFIPRLELASGPLLLPGGGSGPHQLALAWNVLSQINIATYRLSGKILGKLGATIEISTHTPSQTVRSFSLVSGRFNAYSNSQLPPSALAFSYWNPNGTFSVDTIAVSPAGPALKDTRTHHTGAVDSAARMPLMAYDQ